MKKYGIDDCIRDAATARDIVEFISCAVSQKDGRKIMVLTSNGFSGLETVLKTAVKSR